MPRRHALLIALGVALHLYTVLFRADGPYNFFLLALFAWSCLPYALIAALPIFTRRPALATGALLAVLASDLYAHYAVFVAPTSSTDALALLVMPVWNLLLFAPLGMSCAWALGRLRGRAGGGSPG